MIADKDYFLDENRELTTDEAKAAFILARKGVEISKDMADKYGIGKVAQPEEGTEETVEKSAQPSENKAKTPTKNKGAK